MTEQHPDPISEGLTRSGERLVQLVAVAGAVQQAVSRRSTRRAAARRARDKAAEKELEQERKAVFEEARARWAPAHDRDWLKQADLLQVAEVWSAAVPHAEDHAAAASAVRKCEERLRELHPYAMGQYDRFQADGHGRLDAMRAAAPFFTREPNPREGHPATTQALREGTGARWAAMEHGPSRKEWEEARQEQRAIQIVDELQAKRLAGGKNEMGSDELRTVLDVTTNLPHHIIDRATAPAPETAEGKTHGHRSAATVAADDFPYTITEAMEMTAGQEFERPGARRPQQQTLNRNRRLNR